MQIEFPAISLLPQQTLYFGVAMKERDELNLRKALNRMRLHARKTQSAFADSLKVQAPDTSGRLAGPAIPESNTNGLK